MDGTLLGCAHSNDIWIQKLLLLMEHLTFKYNACFAVITGSNYIEALNKLRETNLIHYIHFLSVGFGTHLFKLVNENRLLLDLDWHNNIGFGFDPNSVINLINYVEKFGINLVSENRSFNFFKRSYYYLGTSSNSPEIKIIKKIGLKYGIRLLISQCNPINGDPEDGFDIDFIPINAGKDKVINYIRKNLELSRYEIIAFGDSYNDISMLKIAGTGFAVANATKELKGKGIPLCEYPYCQGIYNQLIQLFRIENI